MKLNGNHTLLQILSLVVVNVVVVVCDMEVSG